MSRRRRLDYPVKRSPRHRSESWTILCARQTRSCTCLCGRRSGHGGGRPLATAVVAAAVTAAKLHAHSACGLADFDWLEPTCRVGKGALLRAVPTGYGDGGHASLCPPYGAD